MRLYYQTQRINFVPVRRLNGRRKRRKSPPSRHLLRTPYLFHLQSPCGIKFLARWLPGNSSFAPFKRFQNTHIGISREPSPKRCLKPTLPEENFGQEAGQCESLCLFFFKSCLTRFYVSLFLEKEKFFKRRERNIRGTPSCSIHGVKTSCAACACGALALEFVLNWRGNTDSPVGTTSTPDWLQSNRPYWCQQSNSGLY